MEEIFTTNNYDRVHDILVENITFPLFEDHWNKTKNLTDFLHSGSEVCQSFEIAHKYYIPCLVTFGLVGNLLSFIVFLTTHLKMRSSSYYLAALAIADFGFLSTLLIVYLSNETMIDIYNKQGWCQGLVYVSSTCAMLSVWFTVAFTVERFIAIQYPLQRPRMCTISRAKTIILTITLLSCLSQTYMFRIADIVTVPKQNSTMSSTNSTSRPSYICDVRPEYYGFMRIVSVLDAFVSLFCPVVMIVVMNTMVVRNLFVFRKQFMFNGNQFDCVVYHTSSSGQIEDRGEASGDENIEIQAHPSVENHGRDSNRDSKRSSMRPSQVTPVATRSVIRYARRVKCSGDSEEQICIKMNATLRSATSVSNRSQQNITKLLLLISSVFILLNLPSYIIRIYIFFAFSIWNEDIPYLLWCAQQTSMVLYYTNFSVNFLLYAVCGKTFRHCLSQMLRKHATHILNIIRPLFKPK